MNRRFFIFLILVLILAVAVWGFVWPEWQSFSSKREELNLWKNNLAETKELKNKLSDLTALYQNQEKAGELEKFFSALPPKDDIPGLLVNLEALASKNGLIIKSVNFVEEGKKAKSAAANSGAAALSADVPAVKKLTVTLVLNGEYSSLLNFLRSAETSLRLMDVESLNFQQAGGVLSDGLSASSDFSIGLKVYYR